MKRKLTSLITLIFVAVILLTAFSACGNNPPPVYFISTPKNVVFENGEMKWDKVDKADEYIVKINGVEYTTTGTFYSDFEPETEYTIQVCSKNVWATSEWTEEKKVIFLAPPTGLVYTSYNNKFYWTESEHASSYRITVDGEEYPLPKTNNHYFDIFEAGDVLAKIKAVGDNETYFDSKYSEPANVKIDVIRWDSIEVITPEGEGSSQNPFLITSVENFKWLTNKVGEDYLFSDGKYFKMTNDVDFRYIDGYIPIGTSDEPFLGNFDGAGHGIYHLSITANNAGVFGCNGDGSTVSNLRFIGGGVNGIITAGAISARNLGQITNCVNYGPIHGNTAGGIVGENTDAKMIYDCVNYGGISGENVGGITGWNWNGTVYSCTNLGAINGTANAGGVVGANVGNIFYCENQGGITSVNAGGICYTNMGIVKASFNGGYISGSRRSGGITATNNGGDVKYCYNIGTVVSDSEYEERYIGGISGYMSSGVILLSYNLGNVHYYGETPRSPGAIVGYYRTGLLSRCYYLEKETDISEVGNTNQYISEDGGVSKLNKEEFKGSSIVDLFNSYVNVEDLSVLETKIFVVGEEYPILYWENN